MEMWSDIRRRVLVKGESKRSVQQLYGIHWTTLNKILSHSEPPGYQMNKPRTKPVLEDFLPIIHEILEADKSVRKKQRHTAKRIFERLKDEHKYPGGYTVVKDAVRAWRRKSKEVFVPLAHPPGEAQVDFGHAEVVIDGVTQLGAQFSMSLPYSDAIFIAVYPRECTESFIDGHIKAFEFFGGVPRRISYDNAKVAVSKIVGSRKRKITQEFQRLISHYLFEYHFCLVRRPNEKGHVERLLDYARANFLVPIPRSKSFEALNLSLVQKCRVDLMRSTRGKESKLVRMEEERKAFLPLPSESYEARRVVSSQANSLSLVRFDSNDYSVPTAYAHHPVIAFGGIDMVRFECDGHVVARHKRIWAKERVSFDPVHYLALLERKPGAFDYAKPLEEWELPEAMSLLRRRLEAKYDHHGTRQFIKVLRLLENFTLKELVRAVEQALEYGTPDADMVRLILEGIREQPVTLFCLEGRPHLSGVHVALPQLKAYGKLIKAGAEVVA